MELARSLLFVPGHRAHMVEKALGLAELDVALLDLEDGVPLGEKEAARRIVGDALARLRGGPLRFVRVNRPGSDALRADLAAVLRPGLAGLVVPKVDRPEDVREVDALASERTPLVPSIETARGLLAAAAIADCSPRVVGLMFGAEDFALDLGVATAREEESRDLLYARSAVAVAAAAARVLAFDGIWPDVRDLEGLRRDAVRGRRLGFTGKTLVHPGQIPIANEVFSPSAEEVERARRVVAAYEDARTRGLGATELDGQLVDPPIVERARRVVAAYDSPRSR